MLLTFVHIPDISNITNTGNDDVIAKAFRQYRRNIKNERALWEETFPKYSNADERKAALSRISQEMDDLNTRKSSTRVILGKRQF